MDNTGECSFPVYLMDKDVLAKGVNDVGKLFILRVHDFGSWVNNSVDNDKRQTKKPKLKSFFYRLPIPYRKITHIIYILSFTNVSIMTFIVIF